MKIRGIHHIAIAVDDLDRYSDIFKKLFDLETGEIEISATDNTSLTFIDLKNCELEFLKPLNDDSSMARFLEKRGPGIHHFCLTVENIVEALEELKAKDIELIDQTPRPGAGGSLIAFIHPRSAGGILIELKQDKEE
ncbi:MAG: methylmalonyl-CoA epimerase [Candidatus Zixiibacteriota bacterium]|nr:MAG: methylmalonyl-CoA epimerase [candidate division Zixibacteria bacterium]